MRADPRADRIAGEADDRDGVPLLAAQHARALRAAWLHRDGPEPHEGRVPVQIRVLGQALLDDLEPARTDAAARDDEVRVDRADPLAQGDAEVLHRVAHDQRVHDGRTRGAQHCREQSGVRVVELARAQRLSGSRDLVAAGHDEDAGASPHLHLCQAECREHAQRRRRERRIGDQRPVALADVAAAVTDELAGRYRVELDRRGIEAVSRLDGHHSVRTRRDGSSRHDRSGRALGHRLALVPGGVHAHDVERAGSRGGGHREAVHLRIVEARQIRGSAEVLEEHAVQRLRHAHGLTVQDARGQSRDEEVDVLVDGARLRPAPEWSVDGGRREVAGCGHGPDPTGGR